MYDYVIRNKRENFIYVELCYFWGYFFLNFEGICCMNLYCNILNKC